MSLTSDSRSQSLLKDCLLIIVIHFGFVYIGLYICHLKVAVFSLPENLYSTK